MSTESAQSTFITCVFTRSSWGRRTFLLAGAARAAISPVSWRAAGRSRAATVLRRALSEGSDAGRSAFKRPVGRMVNPFQFLQEVRAEAKKVTWPTQRETMVTTGLVILMVLFASLFFVIVDWGLRFLVGLMLRVGQ